MLPISSAVAAGDYVFLSGVPPIEEGRVVFPGDAARQTEFIFCRMKQILSSFELSLNHLVYVQVYLRNIQDSENINSVYERTILPVPSRCLFYGSGSCIQVRFVSSIKIGQVWTIATFNRSRSFYESVLRVFIGAFFLLSARRYSLGDILVCCLKTRLKDWILPNPTCS